MPDAIKMQNALTGIATRKQIAEQGQFTAAYMNEYETSRNMATDYARSHAAGTGLPGHYPQPITLDGS